jgi:GT2 family glycosyltransferase
MKTLLHTLPQADRQTAAGIHGRADSEISVVVINYNGRDTLPRTLASIKASGYPFVEIIVVDDGSTDGSAHYVRLNHPDATLVALPENTRNTSLVRNSGLRMVTTPFALLLDNDVTVIKESIEKLLDSAVNNEKLLAITPRLLDEKDEDSIYMDGSALHFLGLTMKANSSRRVSKGGPNVPFNSFGSGIMLIRMAIARDIGLFDERYEFGWGDDGELHLRGRLMGYDVLHHPDAPFLHVAKRHGKKRAYAQLHNRHRFILTYYSRGTLLLLLPSLLVFELGLLLALLSIGLGGDWTRAVATNWRMRKSLLEQRRLLQARRKLRDRELLSSGYFQLPGMVSEGKFANSIVKAIALPLNLNWRLAGTLHHL